MKTRTKIVIVFSIYIGIVAAFPFISSSLQQTTGSEPVRDVSLQVAENKTPQEDNTNAAVLPLQFKPAESSQTIEKESKELIRKIREEIEVDDGKVYIYEKVDDPDNVYAGFAYKKEHYNLGAIGDKLNLGGLSFVKKMTLYGKSVVKFQGTFGSHVSNTNYYVIDQGVPKPFLSTEGTTVEMDLDGDGVKEIITQLPGTIPYVNLFKRDENSFLAASINGALEAASVIFNYEDGSFTAAFYMGWIPIHNKVKLKLPYPT